MTKALTDAQYRKDRKAKGWSDKKIASGLQKRKDYAEGNSPLQSGNAGGSPSGINYPTTEHERLVNLQESGKISDEVYIDARNEYLKNKRPGKYKDGSVKEVSQ